MGRLLRLVVAAPLLGFAQPQVCPTEIDPKDRAAITLAFVYDEPGMVPLHGHKDSLALFDKVSAAYTKNSLRIVDRDGAMKSRVPTKAEILARIRKQASSALYVQLNISAHGFRLPVTDPVTKEKHLEWHMIVPTEVNDECKDLSSRAITSADKFGESDTFAETPETKAIEDLAKTFKEKCSQMLISSSEIIAATEGKTLFGVIDTCSGSAFLSDLKRRSVPHAMIATSAANGLAYHVSKNWDAGHKSWESQMDAFEKQAQPLWDNVLKVLQSTPQMTGRIPDADNFLQHVQGMVFKSANDRTEFETQMSQAFGEANTRAFFAALKPWWDHEIKHVTLSEQQPKASLYMFSLQNALSDKNGNGSIDFDDFIKSAPSRPIQYTPPGMTLLSQQGSVSVSAPCVTDALKSIPLLAVAKEVQGPVQATPTQHKSK